MSRIHLGGTHCTLPCCTRHLPDIPSSPQPQQPSAISSPSLLGTPLCRDLSENLLEGEVSGSFGELENLQNLNLNSNLLNGSLPLFQAQTHLIDLQVRLLILAAQPGDVGSWKCPGSFLEVSWKYPRSCDGASELPAHMCGCYDTPACELKPGLAGCCCLLYQAHTNSFSGPIPDGIGQLGQEGTGLRNL